MFLGVSGDIRVDRGVNVSKLWEISIQEQLMNCHIVYEPVSRF